MTAPARPELSLSPRQLRILRRRAEGLSGPQAARAEGISVGTESYHEQVILTRLHAKSITNAVLLACRAGILDGRPQRHGDHAGYEAHRKRGEDPRQCPHGCWVGEQAHKAAMKARQKLSAPR